ncbi:MAG: phosphoribosylformylglycinamidine cyclo-ligase [Wenzhouxiangellaceae bacterium]|nr:phosphoribosylformylglycinamidine cyclo-ligase [Wenzhouxiangellaceae bacterium]
MTDPTTDSGRTPRSETLDYKSAGVDIEAGNRLVRKIAPSIARTPRDGVLGGVGGFAGLFRLGGDYRDPVLVSGTDGVGTKLLLARDLGDHSSIGIDLVAMCVNDILTCGAKPLFFLDYYACGKLDVDAAAAVVDGIATGCEQAGCALIGGETAEMPGLYAPGHYDLAGFAVGVVERDQIIDGSAIDEDCVLLGLSSSGAHSNGFSLIRKVLDAAGGVAANPTQARSLLMPTQIYTASVLPLLGKHDIRGMAHITGGGLAENVIRVVPDELGVEIDPSLWRAPRIFQWLAATGHIAPEEMLRTFNMGIGFVLIVPRTDVAELSEALIESGDEVPVEIGRVVRPEPGQPRVRMLGQ